MSNAQPKFRDRWEAFKYWVGHFRFFKRSAKFVYNVPTGQEVGAKKTKQPAVKASKLRPLLGIALEGSVWVNVDGCMSVKQEPMRSYIRKGYVRIHSEDITKPSIATVTVLGHKMISSAR